MHATCPTHSTRVHSMAVQTILDSISLQLATNSSPPQLPSNVAVLCEVTDSHGIKCESYSENPTSLNMKALCSFETSGSVYVWRSHIAQERRPQLAAHQSESFKRAVPQNCAGPVSFVTYVLTRTFSIVT